MEKLAIIILNYNCKTDTEKCVDNLIELGVNSKSRIIIVDNKSTDDSFSFLIGKYHNIMNVDVIQTKNNAGYSYGNNCGMKYAIKKFDNIRYLCVMNPDVSIIYPQVFSNIIKKIEINDSIAAMSPVMILNGFFNYEGMCWNLPTEKTIYYDHIMFVKKKNKKRIRVEKNLTAIVDVIPGSFFIIKRQDIEKIGFLDENIFLYNEENVLAKKLQKIGKKVAISLNDFYEHNHPKSKDKKNLKKWLQFNKIGFQSRMYLCKNFYSRRAQVKLKLVNLVNIIYIYLLCLKNILKRR